MTRSCGRDLISKASGLEGSPGSARAATPKPESVCLTILCLSATRLTLAGGYPRPPFSGENQLRPLANKSPGHERNISIQTPCQHSSLLGRFIQTLAATYVIIHSLTTVRGMGSLKHSKNIEHFEELKTIRVVLMQDFTVEPMLVAKFPYLLSTVHLGVHQLTQLECKKNKCSLEINHIRLLS